MAMATTAVTMAAPTLSAVVICGSVEVFCVLSFVPAVGLLVLFPPVVEVTGANVELFDPTIKLDQNIFVALIDSSRPLHPSQLLVYHLTPQVLLPYPVHASAADCAEACKCEMMVS